MRKELDVTIADGALGTNRDFGKVFHLREMPASKAEKWAMRALMALARAGVDIDTTQVRNAGMQGIAVLGVQALMRANFEGDIETLWDEMFQCIEAVPSPNVRRPLIEDDIEEIATRIRLRGEVIKLHVDFSIVDNPLK